MLTTLSKIGYALLLCTSLIAMQENKHISALSLFEQLPALPKTLILEHALKQTQTKHEILFLLKNIVPCSKTIYQAYARSLSTTRKIVHYIARKHYNSNLIKAALAIRSYNALNYIIYLMAYHADNKKYSQDICQDIVNLVTHHEASKIKRMIDFNLCIDTCIDNKSLLEWALRARAFTILRLFFIYLSYPKHIKDALIIKAAQRSDRESVMFLLIYIHNINIQDQLGQTALIKATINNDYAIVKALYNAGAQINVEDATGSCALTYAIESSHDNLLSLLLSDMHAYSSIQKSEALWLAVSLNNKKATKTLLKAGISPNITDKEGTTLLMRAIHYCYGAPKIIKMLLKAGAHPDMQDTYCNTPLLVAIDYGYTPIVKLLLKAKANIALRNNYYQNAYDKALEKNDTETLKLLDKYRNKNNNCTIS